jgi:virginiamycin B lyase
MSTSGVAIDVPLIPRSNSAIAGPDGNLWLAENGNKVGRLSPSGSTLKEFSTPTSDSNPFDIAVGSDGNLWFVEQNAHKIGRITPEGSISEFPVSTAGIIWGIASGSDGNVWFTEYSASKIGRLVP